MRDDLLHQGLAALGHPTRLSLFRRLLEAGIAGRGPTSLADDAGLPRNLVSYHLRPLVVSGLVRSEKRGRDVNYSVDDARFAELIAGMQDLSSVRT